MRRALVLGNGESRASVNIEHFRSSHTLIGCNAIHRDLLVDQLVCCDQRMVREALENPQYKEIPIWVRSEWYQFFRKIQKNKNIRELPQLPYQGTKRQDEPRNWGSGTYAVLLAALEFDSVDLVGFDLYGNNKRVNNIYKGTSNYSGRDSSAVDPNYWIYQIGQIIKLFPRTRFNFINRQEWEMPESWKNKNARKLNIIIDQDLNTLYNLHTEVLGIIPL